MTIDILQPLSFHRQGGRDYQEDSRYPDADCIDASQRFFLVCDGVGGSDHGEVASSAVCQAFAKKLARVDFSHDFTNEQFSEALDYAYDQLDKKGRKTDGDMATTLTFVCFHGGGCTMAHIGDSRIYQVRPSEGIVYKSDDHSLVNNMVHNGLITPDEAIDHPQGNVITRCMEPVGGQENRSMATVVRTENVVAGDCFLLCSDGVSNEVDDDTLVAVLTDPDCSCRQALDRLAGLCKDSDDNNTAILVRVERVNSELDAASDETSTASDDVTATRRFPRQKTVNAEIDSVPSAGKHTVISYIRSLFR